MKPHVTRRWVGACIYLVMLWSIGEYNLSGLPVLLMGIVFPIMYEILVVRPAQQKE